MTQCKRCGSGTTPKTMHASLCDVCYWREKFEDLLAQSRVQMVEVADLKALLAAYSTGARG